MIVLIVGIVVILTAWSIGYLQGRARIGEFEIQVKCPDGRTTLICNKGCNWAMPETWFECNGGTCGAIINENGLAISRMHGS